MLEWTFNPKATHTNQLLRDRIYTIDVLSCVLQTEKVTKLVKKEESDLWEQKRETPALIRRLFE